MSYTIDDLCREIAEKTARERIRWRLTSHGAIRTVEEPLCRCPLQVWTGQNIGYSIAAVMAGLPGDVAGEVIISSDMHGEYRAKLLRATGLA